MTEAVTKLRVLDLFSGIGGFSLGLERAQLEGAQYDGFETVAFCEIEEYPRRVLAKHWPDVPCYTDVRDLTAGQLADDGIGAIDVITGGFPCQDISTAGKQAGMSEGTRSGLWSEIVRLVGELRPQFVIVENVANLLSGPSERPGGWFSRVLGDLAALGYDAEWEIIPASSMLHEHRRERVWVVAYAHEVLRPILEESFKIRSAWQHSPSMGQRSIHRPPSISVPMGQLYADPSGGSPRNDDGLSEGMDRIGSCGNAVIPQIPELIGRAILQSLNIQ